MRYFPEVLLFTAPCLLGIAVLSSVASGQSSIRCWGQYGYDTEGREHTFRQVTASVYESAVLRADGRVFVNGQNGSGIIHVPELPPGMAYVEVGISPIGGAALRSDGIVVVWGWYVGLTMIPSFSPAPPLPVGLQYEQVAVGSHVLALRSDGVIVAWGNNQYGQCTVPALPPGVFARRLRCGAATSYALLWDGSILAWGSNSFGQLQVPALPSGRGFRNLCG